MLLDFSLRREATFNLAQAKQKVARRVTSVAECVLR